MLSVSENLKLFGKSIVGEVRRALVLLGGTILTFRMLLHPLLCIHFRLDPATGSTVLSRLDTNPQRISVSILDAENPAEMLPTVYAL